MALTRPTFQNLNSNLTTFSDALTVTNYGNVANRDIGEVFDRSQGGGSNVAMIWNETTQSFRFAYTSSTGKETGNITITRNADVIVGNLTASNLTITNVTYINQETISSSDTIQGNLTANALTVNNSVTIGTTLGVTGNLITGTGTGGTITGANLISANNFTMITANASGNISASSYIINGTGIFWSNGTQFTSGGGSGLAYTAGNAPPTTGNAIGSQWYNTSTDTLYEYQSDGTSIYWVDITGPAYGSSGDVLSPFLLMGA